MKKRNSAIALCLVTLMAASVSLSGCNTRVQAENLMAGVRANPVHVSVDLNGEETAAVTDFAVRLFQQSLEKEKNTLISPLSILYALGMTANGAKGETLSQMEEVFGLPVTELNQYLYAYRNAVPTGKDEKLCLANSIWFREDFQAVEAFLQTNADWYGAELYRTPFDTAALNDINAWVKDNTDGLIENILDQIPSDSVMYLINALAFDAKWMEKYEEEQVREGVFTKEDGTKRDVELMYSTESKYLEDENAVGFIKYYEEKKFALAALLPDEGVSVADYAAALTGEKLQQVLEKARDVQVDAAIPKFESEYSAEMMQALKAMGITLLFDEINADLSGLGTSTAARFSVGQVLHKTFITVDERGTKAGASTAVGITAASASVGPVEIKTVHLDRPFVYLVIDCEANVPVFFGTAMDIGS